MKLKSIFFSSITFFTFSLFLLLPKSAEARDPSTIKDWYIQDFKSTINLNSDSSLDITEEITADCGNLTGKHGIFRVLPTRYKNPEGIFIDTPIELISITDFEAVPIPYTTTNDRMNHTLTWKIGDPNKVVTGVNNYKIIYKIKKNAVDSTPKEFDRFFWNLSGSNWQIPIDAFEATITIPDNLDKDQFKADTYFGYVGQTNSNGVEGSWKNAYTYQLQSTQVIEPGQGISLKLTMQNGLFPKTSFSIVERYGFPIALIIILATFIFCYRQWQNNGRDPKVSKTVIAEYDPPDKLSPAEMIYLKNGGTGKTAFPAELIFLASRGFIKIEEIEKKVLFIGNKDYKFTLQKDDFKDLLTHQKNLIISIFGAFAAKGSTVMLSDLKYKLSKDMSKFSSTIKSHLIKQGYYEEKSFKNQIIFIVLGTLLSGIASVLAILILNSIHLLVACIISGLIIIIFGFLMSKMTQKGAEAVWKIKGFRLFMNTAERYRAAFNEKENIFEKLLPYAIAFSLTKKWIEATKKIYGTEYINTYHPIWYVGALNTFDVDSLSSAISSVASAVESTSSSGSGGAGGGGGGGGGGGW